MKRAVVAGVVAAVLVAGLLLFEPWTLWTRSTVNEAAPDNVATTSPSESLATGVPVEVSRGGSHVLRLEDFSTSNGPDLHVWLSDRRAGGNWFKYDEGRYVELGELNGTDGNQNYAIRGDIEGFRSVWCKRFTVSFGSAPIAS